MQVTARHDLSIVLSVFFALTTASHTGCVAIEQDALKDTSAPPNLPVYEAAPRPICAVSSQCDSGVCNAHSGACVDAGAIIYVAPDGQGTSCSIDTPCGSLQIAAAAVQAGRNTIFMAAGIYDSGARFAAPVDVAIYGEHATMIDGVGGATIWATDAARVAIYDLTVMSQAKSFVCDNGASLSLTRVELHSLLGIDGNNCADLHVADSRFEGPGVGMHARAGDIGLGHVSVTNTSFTGSAAAIRLRDTTATLAGLVITDASTGIVANVKCAGAEFCVSLLDSAISGATNTPLELSGNGYLIARNRIFDNPAGGLTTTATVLRLESNIIRDNGALNVASTPAISISANACLGCAAQVTLIGNTVAYNLSTSPKGAALRAHGTVVPVLASNIIFGNLSMSWGASQVVCRSCRSYNDLIAPAASEGAVRVAPIQGDPMFTSPLEGDLHPLTQSPARGSGTCTTPHSWVAPLALDVDGQPRSAPCDAGAYEIP